MPRHDHDHSPRPLEDTRRLVNFLLWLCVVTAAPVIALIRWPGSMGVRYFGLHAAVALFWMGIFGAYTCRTQAHVGAIYTLMAVFLVALLVHKVAEARRRWSGHPEPHSRYVGDSILWLPGFTTDRARKKVAEPIIVFALGVGMNASQALQPVGSYFVLGAVALLVCDGMIEMRLRAQARSVNDAIWDQREMASFIPKGV